MRREEERTMSKTGKEVRELQREVSRQMQEGWLGSSRIC